MMVLRTILIVFNFIFFFFLAIYQDYLNLKVSDIVKYSNIDAGNNSTITFFTSNIVRIDNWYSKPKLVDVDTVFYNLKMKFEGP